MVMEFLCCEPLEVRDSQSDGSVTCSTDEDILECDYDTQVTKLYKNIEDRQWEEVLYFLQTGKWYSASVFNGMWGEKEESPSTQARTWVTALDESGNVRWCQLPLHAAVTFLAPFSVVSKLVEVYPKSVRCADDQDMLPLHYAFRFGAGDDVLVFLMEKFPAAIGKKAVKDRLPLDLAQYGPRPERGRFIDYYMQSAVRNAKADWDNEYEKMVATMQTAANSDLQAELSEKTERLAEALTDLKKTKKDLGRAEKELKKLQAENKKDCNSSIRTNRSVKTSPSMKSAKSTSGRSRKTEPRKPRAEEKEKEDEGVEVTTPKTTPKTKKKSSKKAVAEEKQSSIHSRTLGAFFGKRKK